MSSMKGTVDQFDVASVGGGPVSYIRPRTIAGVDTIRFVAAMWVAFSHGAQFPVDQFVHKTSSLLGLVIVGVSHVVYSGIDAVVVFFLISGLCIHYPNVGAKRVDPLKFIPRRLVRVGIPLIGAIAIAHVLGLDYVNALNAVLWTVYCELTYYVAYPVLFWVSKKISWQKMIMASSIVSLVMAACSYRYQYIWQFGILTGIYCLPFWLLGVRFAEQISNASPPKSNSISIWIWRLGAIIHGLIVVFLLDHSKIMIGTIWTVPPFAIYCYFWIPREISRFQSGAPRYLELLGMFSYSLYLMHKIPITLIARYEWQVSPIVQWIIVMSAIISSAFCFYILVERPSHALARRIGARRASS
jgi:peptidoglycan/LPS O-acetylase OafA/YrhL